MIRKTRNRNERKGGALIAALLFMTATMISGTALLGISMIHRLDTIRNGIDVRLMMAAEAGVETVRGRFTLIQGVQENWNWLSDSTWTTIGTPVINGTTVTVQAKRGVDPSVPIAQVRAFASASNITRVVEKSIKVGAFSDYAIYIGDSSSSNWGYFKCVGNFYSAGSCNFGASGTEFFGEAITAGVFTGKSNVNFHVPPQENHPLITMPDDIAQYSAIENGAKPPYLTTNHVYYENTLEIQLQGTNYRRIFVRRKSNGSNGVAPPSWSGGSSTITGYPGGTTYGRTGSSLSYNSGAAWVSTGNPNGTSLMDSSAADRPGGLNVFGAPYAWDSNTIYGSPRSSVENTYYELAWETLPIPHNGVIYVKMGSPAAYGSTRDSQHASDLNRFTQRPINHIDLDNVEFTTGGSKPNNYNGYTRSPVLLLSGNLTDRRVTICGDGVNVTVRDNITYNTLRNNPGLRRDFDAKTSAAALAIPEMLGVISRERWQNQTTKSGQYLGGGDVNMAYRYWRPLPSSAEVNDIAGDTGHMPTQMALDGVFLGTNSCGAAQHDYNNRSQEIWYCGGLIAHYTTYYLENCWEYVHYDWDWRMQLTTPPFFLSSYNATAKFIPGTWRTWRN